MRSRISIVLLCALGGGCVSPKGIQENLGIASSTTPVLGEVQEAELRSEATLDSVASEITTASYKFVFYGEVPTGESEGDIDTLMLPPEERLARRRHAMGLPDSSDRRLAERQAARRREAELKQGQ